MMCRFFMLIVASFVAVAASAESRLPNIVVILADDMGWGDPQCYNVESRIPTPGIDRLASEGIRFTDAHTPSSVCTPTRYGLLTGRYCWRTRLKSSVLDGFSPPLIEPTRTTIASLLKRRGYATACVGKWHLGMQWTRKDGSLESEDRRDSGFRSGYDIDFTRPIRGGPLSVGFDHFFGISASLDMPPYCWINDDRCDPVPTSKNPTAKDRVYISTAGGVADAEFKLDKVLPRLKKHATEWIARQHRDAPDRPFFLYLPLNSPHLPIAPSAAFRGRTDVGEYGDFVAETDDCVKSVLETLDEIGQRDNTLVIFTSDNGGLWHRWDAVEADDVAHYEPTIRGKQMHTLGHRSNAHLRGTKADIWEGGHRVPFVVRWPDHVPAGETCDQVIELTDLLATVASIIETPLGQDAGPDSHSFLPLLETPGSNQPIREYAIHHSLRGDFSIRMGRWKLMPQRGSGGFSQPRKIAPKPGEPTGQLYDLETDPSETKNVWNENPKIVDRLLLKLDAVARPMNRQRIRFASTADGSEQEAYLILPDEIPDGETVPLVVSLHSWSANMEQRNIRLERLVHDRGWVYLFPNFRGANKTPAACGSPLAQQDILDSVQWTIENHAVDPNRVYLTGNSGGGHMTMLMAARYPDRWKAASAWVGISDLVAWHGKHKGSNYGGMMEQSCGGAPGDSLQIDQQYQQRSPLTHLAAAKSVAIDIAAGVHDGHSGSVPIRHSIDAFNAISTARGDTTVSKIEIEQLSRKNGRLDSPTPSDTGFDPTFGREFYLRRQTGSARLTIFEGGHEGIATAAMAWFERH